MNRILKKLAVAILCVGLYIALTSVTAYLIAGIWSIGFQEATMPSAAIWALVGLVIAISDSNY